jgi:hypothetical protein
MVSNKHEQVFLLITPSLGKCSYFGVCMHTSEYIISSHIYLSHHLLLTKLYKIVKLSFIMEIGQSLQMLSCVGTIILLTFEHMDFGIFCSYPHLVQTSSVKITYLGTYSWHRLEIEHNVQLFLVSQT